MLEDRARKKTDKMLRGMERRVRAVYSSDPSLLRMQKKYENYMESVKLATQESYEAYKNAPAGDERDRLKQAYVKEVRDLTINNRLYKDLISEFTRVMAQVNQTALDIVNSEMEDVYMVNYNQVAVDCKKVGIKVERNA